MAPASFPLFPLLCQDIRDKIWEAAANLRPRRRGRPGVHFFVVPVDKKVLLQTEEIIPTPLLENAQAWERQGRPDGRGGLSAYWIDNGLWSACRDSRRAVKRRWADTAELLPRKARSCHRFGGEKRSLVVFPVLDLFCLRPVGKSPFRLWMLEFSCAKLFGEGFRGGCAHIGLEYDPRWRDSLTPASVLYWLETRLSTLPPQHHFLLELFAEKRVWAQKIWIIDYDILRISCSHQPRTVFYGNGCIFSEVLAGDTDWDPETYKDVYDLLYDLFNPLQVYLDGILMSREEGAGQDFPGVGVLACESVGPRRLIHAEDAAALGGDKALSDGPPARPGRKRGRKGG